MKKIFEKLSAENYFAELAIDSPYLQAHKVAVGTKKSLIAIGASRGSKNSKVHTDADEQSRPHKIF